MLLPPLPSAAGALQAGADTPARAAQEAGGSRKDSKPGYGHDADPVLKKLRAALPGRAAATALFNKVVPDVGAQPEKSPRFIRQTSSLADPGILRYGLSGYDSTRDNSIPWL